MARETGQGGKGEEVVRSGKESVVWGWGLWGSEGSGKVVRGLPRMECVVR